MTLMDLISRLISLLWDVLNAAKHDQKGGV